MYFTNKKLVSIYLYDLNNLFTKLLTSHTIHVHKISWSAFKHDVFTHINAWAITVYKLCIGIL